MINTTLPRISGASALGLLVTMGIMWGLQFAMLKQAASGGHSDLSVLMISLVLMSIAFSAITIARKERVTITRQLVVFLIVTGLLGYVIPLMAALYAAPELSTGVLVLIISLSPVVAICTALALRSEVVTARRMVAVGLGLLSVLVVLWPELTLPGHGSTYWMLVAFLVPLTYGIESVYISRYWPDGLSSMVAVAGETVMAGLLVAPIYAIYGDAFPETLNWTAAEIAIVVFVLAGIVESVIFFYLIRHTGGVLVNFGAFISLCAGIGWGIVLFSESHPPSVWFAVAILVVALAVAAKSTRPAAPVDET